MGQSAKYLFNAGKLLLLDLASTVLFLVVYLLTQSIPLAVALGIALGFAQIGWQVWRTKPIDTMQWMSLILVVASGAATLVTHDPRFVMFKPTLIYIVVGTVMLRRGWINRYLPAITLQVVPDIAVIFGFVWSGLMFFSAALNAFVALNFGVVIWAVLMPVYGVSSKVGLLLIQFATMRRIGLRRHHAQLIQPRT